MLKKINPWKKKTHTSVNPVLLPIAEESMPIDSGHSANIKPGKKNATTNVMAAVRQEKRNKQS